ncbi:MAG: selenium-dependent molybdenum cofactor biosynthesis protein YqeB [Desulforhopalus sp.]
MLNKLFIIIKGAGEMASGLAWRLYRAGFTNIVMLEIDKPMAVRRSVCFCEAVYDGRKTVDGIEAILAKTNTEIGSILEQNQIAVVVDPQWQTIEEIKPQVVIDAILAKKNLGTRIVEADLVIGLGPGFIAGEDVDVVVETNRGPNCGRLLYSGSAEKDTGIPGTVMGFDLERVIRAPTAGLFKASVEMNDHVQVGDTIGIVDQRPVIAAISGVTRGLIRDKIFVSKGLKIGDIEPRQGVDTTKVSDKSLGLGGAVLEALLAKFNV